MKKNVLLVRNTTSLRGMCGLFLCLTALCGLPSAVSSADWFADERMIASVKLPAKAMTLTEACEHLARQTTSEFYVDRRHTDIRVAFYAGEMQLSTAMTIIEATSGLQWRAVDDLFFLSPNARGLAVTRWWERYEEAKKAHRADVADSQVRQWLYSSSPFPPKLDPPWRLTPIQMEQFAYERTLRLYTLTPPQIYWLDSVLSAKGFKPAEGETPTRQLAKDSTDIPIRLNAAMVVHSQSQDFIVEKQLARPVEEPATPPFAPKPAQVEPSARDETQETKLKGALEGIWVIGGDLSDISNLLAKAKQRGVDNIFLPVLRAGSALYPSKLLPQEKRYSGSDPLKQAIAAAKVLGITVYAVLDATLWGDADHPLPPAANYPVLQDRNLLGRTYAEQEEWQRAEPKAIPNGGTTVPDGKRIYLCPASSQVPRLLRSMAREIVSNYEVDGICLDGVDYPESTPLVLAGQNMVPPFGYTVEVRKAMIRAHQVDPIDVDASDLTAQDDGEAYALWDRFRRGKLTGLIAEVCSGASAVRPNIACYVTVNPASESQSPAHWSKIAGVGGIIPRLNLTRPTAHDPFTYSDDDAEAVTALHYAVSKNAVVAPAIGELRSDSLADQMAAVSRAIDMVRDKSLKGYILCGDVSALSSALDALSR